MRSFWLLAALGVGLAGPAQGQSADEEGLRLRAVRLYRGDGTTRVKALLEVPHQLLGPASGGLLRFQVGVKVQDSTGLTIMDREWPQAARAVPGAKSAAALEMLEFAVTPGRYTLNVRIRDSASGKEFETSRQVVGYSGPPLISDLMLTPALRVADPSDTVPKGGEWRHGNLVLIATPYARVAPKTPQVYYMLEAYAQRTDTAQVSVEVLTDSGMSLSRTRPRKMQVDSGGSIVSGGLNLGGVPEGKYRLRVRAAIGGRDTTEEAEFAVRQPETLAAPVAGGVSDEDFFAGLNEKQLDSLAAPLVYIEESGETAIYKNDLSVPAKIRFLTSFWSKRDPTPSEPGNRVRDEFYARIGFVNHTFRDPGRGATPGWRTDRGRIYLKFGAPDDRWERPQEGKTPALEVWKYTGRNRYFIFVDRARIGLFSLAHSDEIREPGRPDWIEVIGYYGLQAIERYLGVDLGIRGADQPR